MWKGIGRAGNGTRKRDDDFRELFGIIYRPMYQMEIWQEIAADKERGARRLVAECGDRMFTAAFLLCHDQGLAEDLVFRVFACAVRKIGQYKGKASFFSWLYSILINLYRTDCRKMKAAIFETGEIPEDAASAWGEVREPLGMDEALAVRRAVQSLPPIFREVVVLRYFEDRSLLEMAELMSVPLNTVKSRLRLAQGRLNAMLVNLFGQNERRRK